MNIKFVPHDANSGSSCHGLVEYLNKENEINTEKLKENFFNQQYSENEPNQDIQIDDVKEAIDSNRGSRKLSESNFYMLNISPSKEELKHIENLAVKELIKRGYQDGLVYEEAKEELMKMQLKLYTKNLMQEYAANFEREIYINPSKIPNNTQKQILEKEASILYNEFLKEKGVQLKQSANPKEWKILNELKILSENKKSLKVEMDLESFGTKEISIPRTLLHLQKDGSYKIPQTLYNSKINEMIDNDYGKKREEIYVNLATNKGFDLNKRRLTADDLLWYGKVETQRHYKHTDREVIYNKQTSQQIKLAGNSPELLKNLESKLIRDAISNEVIMHNTLKGGNHYHVHVLISRHDKTNQNSRDKISLSPLASAKNKMLLAGKNQVGFNRSGFFQAAEQIFDKKFGYERPLNQSYEYYNLEKKKNTHENYGTTSKNLGRELKSEVKNLLLNHTGINELRRELNPIQNIKEQLNFAKIPTSYPKSITDLSIKILKKAINLSNDMGY